MIRLRWRDPNLAKLDWIQESIAKWFCQPFVSRAARDDAERTNFSNAETMGRYTELDVGLT